MKNLLAVLGIVLLSAVSASAAEVPAEISFTSPAIAPDEVPEPQAVSSCLPIQQSPIYSALGSTCAQAQSNVQSTLMTYSDCECGHCSRNFVYQACESTQNGYLVKGYVRFSCKAVTCEASVVPPVSEFLSQLME